MHAPPPALTLHSLPQGDDMSIAQVMSQVVQAVEGIGGSERLAKAVVDEVIAMTTEALRAT